MPEGFNLDELTVPPELPGPIEWNDQQAAALADVRRWFQNDDQVFRLFGYAGTGKTTLAKQIAADTPGRVLFGAFTGKAALVLRQKGNASAQTIHRMIYVPRDKSAMKLVDLKAEYVAELGRKPCDEALCNVLARKISDEQKRLKQPAFSLNIDSEVRFADLVIIDEVSMVGAQMAEDLLSFGVKVLVLGDPAQLPPVGDGGYFTNVEPDVLLTEIHRQEEGSPIIELATRVRLGKGLELGTFGDSAVAQKGTYSIEEIATDFDQILCGRNKTRRIINRRVREEVLGRTSPLPESLDRLVCLRNNHELGILNGSLWTVREVIDAGEDDLLLIVEGEEGQIVESVAHKAPFLGRALDHFERRNADEFDFGYALTCHKAQGSQWGSVFIVDESGCFNASADRWLYTAITRAADRVAVVV